jgi:hypothetical protein
MDTGMLFIYTLFFIGAWAFTKSPLIAGGAVAMLWSVISFFKDEAAENRARIARASEYQVQSDIFRNGRDDE